ncbi:MAG: hypothetical protein WD990_05205 [Acidimicrobiia bacterium]
MTLDAVPRWLGLTWIVGGVLTGLGALVGMLVGWSLVAGGGDAVTASVDSARRALTAVSETTRVVDDTFDAVADSLRGVQITMSDTSLTLTQASAVTRNLGTVITVDVPESVDAVRATLPGLIRTAGVVDSAMRGLSFFGVDYDPEVPLDESIGTIDAQLAEIPMVLRAQQATLDSVAGDLRTFSSATLEIADDLAAIRLQLAAASDVLGSYESLVTDGGAVLDDLEDRVGTSVSGLRIVVLLVGIGLIVTQAATVAAGVAVVRAHRDPDPIAS